MYGIMLKNGDDRIKCKDCGGEGSLAIHGSLKVCKVCGGLGTVPLVEEAQRVLRQFRLPTDFTVSHEHSVVFRYRASTQGIASGYAYDDIIHALQALCVSGIKAQIIYPIH